MPTQPGKIATSSIAHLPSEMLDSLRSPDVVMLVNPALRRGAIGAVNQAALDLLGYSADDLIGQPIGRFFVDRLLGRRLAGERAASRSRRPIAPQFDGLRALHYKEGETKR